MDVRSRRASSTHELNGEVVEKMRDILEWGGESLDGDHHVRGCGFGGRGFDTHGCFILCLPRDRLSGCCRFFLELLRPSRLPGGGHFRLRRSLRDQLKRGFRIWWWP